MHVMAIGAHAFDAEALAGGLIARSTSQGHSGTLIHLTRGERGDPEKPPDLYAHQLEGELQAAAQILGGTARWMGYPAGQVPISDDVALSLCYVIRELQPDLVVTHWRGSWHPRHVATHHNVLQAIRFAADGNLDGEYPAHAVSQLYFGENCEDLDGFRPSIYVDVTEALDVWFDALACYELFRKSVPGRDDAQVASTGIPYFMYYRSMARVRGLESGFAYAQAFMPARQAIRGMRDQNETGTRFDFARLIT